MRTDLQAYLKGSIEAVKFYCRVFGATLGSVPWASLCATLIDKFGIFWYIAKPRPYGPVR